MLSRNGLTGTNKHVKPSQEFNELLSAGGREVCVGPCLWLAEQFSNALRV
jgi:hypothetical protein